MHSHFVLYRGFRSTEEDQIHHGGTLHVVCPILSIPYMLMPWRLKEPGHQQAWYWPNKPEYSISSIRRINTMRPEQNSHHFADGIFNFIFFIEKNLSKPIPITSKSLIYQEIVFSNLLEFHTSNFVSKLVFFVCLFQAASTDLKGRTSRTVLQGIVDHFMKLFDVPHISSVYTRMNDIYTKLGEANNAMKALREILGLGRFSCKFYFLWFYVSTSF